MWYNGCTLSDLPSNLPKPKCNQCGSDLGLVTKKTAQIGNSFSPMTTTTYRCSDQACQDEIDRMVSKRLQLREERELARQNRLKLNHPPQVQESSLITEKMPGQLAGRR